MVRVVCMCPVRRPEPCPWVMLGGLVDMGSGCSTSGLQVLRVVVQLGRVLDPARGPWNPGVLRHDY